MITAALPYVRPLTSPPASGVYCKGSSIRAVTSTNVLDLGLQQHSMSPVTI